MEYCAAIKSKAGTPGTDREQPAKIDSVTGAGVGGWLGCLHL